MGILIVGADRSATALARALGQPMLVNLVEQRSHADWLASQQNVDIEDELTRRIDFDTDLVDARWRHRDTWWRIRTARATGIEFRRSNALVLTSAMANAELDLTGTDGSLWRPTAGPRTFETAGFPNLFCLNDPPTDQQVHRIHDVGIGRIG